MERRRRELLLMSAAAATIPSGLLPAPALSQGLKELTLVTTWTTDMPGWWTSAVRLAASIAALSDGRLKIKVYPTGELVNAFETFDAVAAGVADMYHAADNYFGAKVPALDIICSAPYGMTADELSAWLAFGGGQTLWDEVVAPFNIKSLASMNTGVQMGGWFIKEVNTAVDFKGLRYRMPGLGAEVLRRMGATVVTIPASEIITALRSGAIDASEWVGPWTDIALGLDKVANYYYYPGFHEPGTSATLGINKKLWDGMSVSDRIVIEAAAQAEFTRSLGEFNAENIRALKVLRADPRIKLTRFNDVLIREFGRLSKEVIADTAAKDPLTRKIADSYMAFLAGVMDWGELSETGYRDTRRLALG
jgi:TRAP-type mannitol/chloroaromatic compound transport system substrate-binding protein